MNKEIRNIVFDVGMVLIDFCWKKPCKEYGFSDELIAAFEKNMITSEYWDQMDCGLLDEDVAIEKFIERMPQYEQEIRTFWSAPEKLVEEFSYAAPLIQELKDKGYRVYLLSNYPLRLHEIHWPTFAFFKLVDGYVVSAAERMAKPDPAIYKLLCERYALKPEECLFIDDREVNVNGAKKIGMQAVPFTGEQTLRSYLELI